MKLTCKNLSQLIHSRGLHADLFKSGSNVFMDLTGNPREDDIVDLLRGFGLLVYVRDCHCPYIYVVQRKEKTSYGY